MVQVNLMVGQHPPPRGACGRAFLYQHSHRVVLAVLLLCRTATLSKRPLSSQTGQWSCLDRVRSFLGDPHSVSAFAV